MLTEPQACFLADRRVGHFATADARATPHLVPVCFVVSDGTLYITIDQKPKGDFRGLRRLRNIIENPVAAFVADRWDEDWTRLGWVMLRGPTEILADGAEHDRPRTAQSFCVPKADIAAAGYDLSLNRYKEVENEEVAHESPTAILADLRRIEAEIAAGMKRLEEMVG